MSLNVSDNGGATYAPIPEDTYIAVCYGVIDLGMQYNERYGNSSNKVMLLWELPDLQEEGQDLPRTFSQKYTASLNSKSALRRDLAAWRGRDFTDRELEAFDLRNILGVPCLLQIIHKESNGRIYANLASITKLPKSMSAPRAQHELMSFDLDEDPIEDLAKVPKWIVDIIKESETFKARLDAEHGRSRRQPVDVENDDGNYYGGSFEEDEESDELPF